METVKLEELCSDIVDCPHSTPNWLDSGIPVIRNYNIVNGILSSEELSYVDEETYLERTRRAVPQHGDSGNPHFRPRSTSASGLTHNQTYIQTIRLFRPSAGFPLPRKIPVQTDPPL